MTSLGDYSKPQNKLDEMLMEKFPHIPLSLMRDIYEIHKDFSEEQQEDFNKAEISNDWTEYDKKYNINNIDYNTYDKIQEQMNEKIIEEIEN